MVSIAARSTNVGPSARSPVWGRIVVVASTDPVRPGTAKPMVANAIA
jgi:hypothetical protein